MLTDIKNSIKAKLYDFTYTPFMSSVVISWIVLNHKYLLIYFGTAPLKEKLIMLNAYSFSCPLTNAVIPYAMNIWFPILFGLFYVFAYPWASKIFYEYTLERTKALKTIKQSIEDATPITQEEARQIRSDITRLVKERDELSEKLVEAEAKCEEKCDKKIFDYAKAQDSGKASVTPKTLEKTMPIEDDKLKILRFFYTSNYKPMYTSRAIDAIVSNTKVARPKVQKVITNLISEKTLEKKLDSAKREYIHISKKGNDTLLDLFDDEKTEEGNV